MAARPLHPGIGSTARATVRLALYGGWTLLLIPVQAAALALKLRAAETIPYFYHRACTRLLGFTVTVRGKPSAERPTLFVSNHTSYLDITILGGLIRGSFVAKAEVATWPVFGYLARLQRSVFIERRSRLAADHRDQLQERLDAHENLILFPEGTSHDGNRILPFKSALLSVAERRVEGHAVTVQPVSIAYTGLDGIPLGRAWRPFFAWYGDMSLAPHLWTALRLGRPEVTVEFHPPVSIADYGDRRKLAAAAQALVAKGVEQAVMGRPPAVPKPPKPPSSSASAA